MVQLSPRVRRLAIIAAVLLLLGGAGRLDPTTAAAGVASPVADVAVIGDARSDSIERVVQVLTHDLALPLPAGMRVHVYTTREAFRRGLVKDAKMAEDGADEL